MNMNSNSKRYASQLENKKDRKTNIIRQSIIDSMKLVNVGMSGRNSSTCKIEFKNSNREIRTHHIILNPSSWKMYYLNLRLGSFSTSTCSRTESSVITSSSLFDTTHEFASSFELTGSRVSSGSILENAVKVDGSPPELTPDALYVSREWTWNPMMLFTLQFEKYLTHWVRKLNRIPLSNHHPWIRIHVLLSWLALFERSVLVLLFKMHSKWMFRLRIQCLHFTEYEIEFEIQWCRSCDDSKNLLPEIVLVTSLNLVTKCELFLMNFRSTES